MLFGGSLVVLLLHELSLVESKLRTLQHVTIGATALTRARSDDAQDATGGELLIERLGDRVVAVAVAKLHGHRLGALGFNVLFLNLFTVLHLDTNLLTVVLSIPGAERRGVDSDDGALHERLGTNKFVVGRVVNDIQDARLARARLRTPREVTSVEAERAVLDVTAAASHLTHGDVGGELRVRRLTTELVPTRKKIG